MTTKTILFGFVIIVTFILMLIAMFHPRYVVAQEKREWQHAIYTPQSPLYRWVDKQYGIVCYSRVAIDNLSCVQMR